MYAPIALFTYNRADHTQKALESLLKNAEAKDSDIFIFSDGPKNEKAVEGVTKNREYIREVKKLEGKGLKSVTLVEREKNWGLANSLIAGITELTERYGKVIVVEDDLVLSPYFLKYMNDALEKYKDDDRVGAISGFLFPFECNAPDTFFVRIFSCWGWATWKRSWKLFNPDASDLLRQLRWKKYDFNIRGSFPAYEMLVDQKRGNVDSWAIRFSASLFLANKLILYPSKSLTKSTGLDGTGVHCGNGGRLAEMDVLDCPVDVKDVSLDENNKMYDEFVRYHRFDRPRNMKCFYTEFKSLIRRILNLDC